MSRGVIYIASGKSYIEEAIQSASSLKSKMPDMNITLFSSENIKSAFFDNVMVMKKKHNCI